MLTVSACTVCLLSYGRFVWLCSAYLPFIFHFGITLTLENNAARPAPYAVKKNLRATFSGRTMIWTGLLIFVFLVYHLLHFTMRLTNPDISNNIDALGRLDVFKMVVFSFKNFAIAGIYIVAMIILALHLSHGVQSFVQTFGLNSDKTI